jgi:hypothetical protein
LGAALLGWKAAELSTRGRVIAAHLRLLTMLYGTHAWRAVADCPAVLDQYVRLRECCADVGAVQFQREQDPPAGVEDSLAASEITADSLIDCGVHFFSPEVWQGEAYCWSAPRAAVRLLLPPGEVVIRLDARPTGRWLSRRPKLYLDGVRIPAQQVSEESGIVQVRVGHAQSRGGDVLLSWSCRPFVPARSGLADRRKLGVALIGVRAERQSQLARIPARERAA